MTIPTGIDNGTFAGYATRLNQRVTDPLAFVPLFRRWGTMNDGTDTVSFVTWPGSPEGNIVADIGSLGLDSANGSVYVKTTDTVNTGWVLLSAGAAFVWQDFAPGALAISNGYFATGAGAYTLPLGAVDGETIEIVDQVGGGVVVTAAVGQFIQVSNVLTLAGGTATSTQSGDALRLKFRLSNLTWICVPGAAGNWILT